jgi:hypothetical protein
MVLFLHAYDRRPNVSTPNTRNGFLVNNRRSQRIFISVPLRVSGHNDNGVAITEEASTMVVNADGCLIVLKMRTAEGRQLKIKNLWTGEETACSVVDISGTTTGVQEVGLAFSKENSKFWRVSFPPVDWSPRSVEAKRFRSPTAALDSNRSTIVKK